MREKKKKRKKRREGEYKAFYLLDKITGNKFVQINQRIKIPTR